MQHLAAEMVLTGMQWRVGWSPWTLWSSCLLEHCPAVESKACLVRHPYCCDVTSSLVDGVHHILYTTRTHLCGAVEAWRLVSSMVVL